MTKKHFDAVAAALLASKPTVVECFTCLAELKQWEIAATNVANAIDRVCPNFNRARFAKACGLT